MMKFHRPDAPPCDKPILYRGAGLEGIYLCNGYKREEEDGEWFTQIEDIEGLHNAIALHLVGRESSLARSEIRFIRNTMDKTQAEIAQAMGVDDQTVARWEKGKSVMPGPADRMLRIMFLASIVGADAILDYIAEVQRLNKLKAEPEEAVTFVRDPAAEEWVRGDQAKVLEDA